ncbi:hypothetical protein L1787_05830 [Acuticoccus sp. M5D2P5]|uniref:hypothetical protein n=1 Tax=Acuticoccus kalidii TaxID=2910977 RepID=UPI001F39DE1B|nr:hypothetical protein [Acuticoccus kalidii]MCF3932933.1 hypothetical protein [Acuticoccus kalidii]
MKRLAMLTLSAVFLVPGAVAYAATPVPKPKPISAAEADPQAAITQMVGPRIKDFGNSVAAYAPANGPDMMPAATDEAALYLVGKLSAEGGPISDGLVWRVFREIPGPDGELPLVHKSRGGDLEVRLKPGRYIVHASYGRASQSRTIDLNRPILSDTFVLNAGGLLLTAVLDEDEKPVSDDTEFEVFKIDGESRKLVGELTPGAIARLPAGNYHVVSRYGGVNAIRTADVSVDAGKLTRVSMRHHAGTVRLKLARNESGEALANTSWVVYGSDGNAIYQRAGAHANVTLAAGEYKIVARHGDNEFFRSITVESGEDADVVVLAQRL